MKATLVQSTVIGLGIAIVLLAVTGSAFAVTHEEIAKCERMIKEMGASAPHVHSSDKGQGPSPMSAEHSRCNAILADARKKAEKK